MEIFCRPNCCHVSLAFVLKLLNFLQAFIAVSILVYSAWMLNQWNHHIPIVPPPPSAPSPDSSSFSSLRLSSDSAAVADQITPLDFAVPLVSGFDEGLGFGLNSFKLPAPWFIYSFMGLGILTKKGYDGAKVDVWSCGVILYVLNAGFLPFNDPNLMAMYKKIYKGEFRCPKWMSSDLKRFLGRLMDTNPDLKLLYVFYRRSINGVDPENSIASLPRPAVRERRRLSIFNAIAVAEASLQRRCSPSFPSAIPTFSVSVRSFVARVLSHRPNRKGQQWSRGFYRTGLEVGASIHMENAESGC